MTFFEIIVDCHGGEYGGILVDSHKRGSLLNGHSLQLIVNDAHKLLKE
jgi:hypothetical protein